MSPCTIDFQIALMVIVIIKLRLNKGSLGLTLKIVEVVHQYMCKKLSLFKNSGVWGLGKWLLEVSKSSNLFSVSTIA